MKIIKRVVLGIVAISIIVGIGLALLTIIEKQRILKAVSSGQLTIDQVRRDWGVCKNNSPVRIEMYIRNNSDHTISGNLVFLVTLSGKGLEEKFIRDVIECDQRGDEERLKREMADAIAQKGSIGRVQGVYNYLMRGKKLPPGQEYEPSTIIADNDYAFKFSEQIFLRPGELIKIDHEEQIPLTKRGNLFSIKIDSIKF